MTGLLCTVKNGSFFTKLLIYSRLSDPGWVQAAVTLGGGSLAGALYLGVIGSYKLLWLQPLAMLCGIVMLSYSLKKKTYFEQRLRSLTSNSRRCFPTKSPKT